MYNQKKIVFFSEGIIFLCFVLFAVVCFITGSMLGNASIRMTQQQKQARLELIKSDYSVRDKEMLKTDRQKRYERYSMYFKWMSLGTIISYPLYLAVRYSEK